MLFRRPRESGLLLLLLLFVFTQAARASGFVPHRHRRLDNLGHLQSGPDTQGSSFASAAIIDPSTQTVHIIGNSYGTWWSLHSQTAGITSGFNNSNNNGDVACFHAVVQIPGSGETTTTTDLSWGHSELMGRANVDEACFTFILDRVDQYRKFIVGNSQPQGGLLKDLFNDGVLGAEEVVRMGMVLDYKLLPQPNNSSTLVDDPLLLFGGRVEQQARVTYPVAIAANPNDNAVDNTDISIVYVASMLSDDPNHNNLYRPGIYSDPSQYLTYGSKYRMNIRAYTKLEDEADNPLDSGSINGATIVRSLVPGKTREFGTTEGQSVQVSAMIHTGDRLVMAGSTKGLGVGFSVQAGQQGDAGRNVDGFVTQFDLQTLNPKNDSSVTIPTYRVASGEDDFVTGLCWSRTAPTDVFVVGHSQGHVGNSTAASPGDQSIRAFVMKLSLADMRQPVWIVELNAKLSDSPTVAKAISCAVTRDGASVYVAGEVENSGVMESPTTTITESFGGTDAWVAQIGAQAGTNNDGKVIFVQQVGSSAEDRVAFRGGIQVDVNNMPILIGNTRGEVYRHRDSDPLADSALSDVFVARIKPGTGEVDHPVEHSEFVSLAPQATRPPIPAPPTPAPVPPTPAPVVAPTPAPMVTDDDSSSSLLYKVFEKWVEILVIILIVAAVLGFCYEYYNPQCLTKRDVPTDRKKVLNYLHDFDVEDVELKRSATGGWRCLYVGDLKDGINNQEPGTASLGLGALRYRDKDPLKNQAAQQLTSTPKFEDEFLLDESEKATSGAFGTNRNNRQDRGLGATLKSAYHEYSKFAGGDSTENKTKKLSPNQNLHAPSSFEEDEGGLRLNRAQERWQNREII